MAHIFKNFMVDLKVKEFIPLKILELISQAAIYSFYPFLSIHARDIGITAGQYGVISIIIPFLLFPVPVITGMIADKIGNFKWFLCITMILNGISGLLYITVPTMETRIVAVNTSVKLHCNTSYILSENSSNVYNEELQMINNICNYDCIAISDSEKSYNGQDVCRIAKECQVPAVTTEYNITEESDIKGNFVIETEAYNYNSTHYLVDADHCTENEKIKSYNNGTITDSSCLVACENYSSITSFNITREEIVTNYYIIVMYTTFRIINAIFLAGSIPLLFAAVVTVLKEKNGDLGFQRMFGKFGTIIFTPLTGLLIDYFSTENNTDYRPAFYTFFILNCIGAITVLFVDLGFKSPSKAIKKEVKSLLQNPEVVLLIATSIIIGISFGVLETYFFWLLEDLGADKLLMGLTVTVGAVAGIIINFFSTEIIGKFGCADCISFAISMLVIRLIGYSMISNPWWAMPFEALEGFTMTLYMNAVTTHATVLSSITTLATLQSIVLGYIYGIGKGVGSLIGGFIIGIIGVKSSFRIMALVCVITCLIYTSINKLLIRNKATSLNQSDYDTKEMKPNIEITHKGNNV